MSNIDHKNMKMAVISFPVKRKYERYSIVLKTLFRWDSNYKQQRRNRRDAKIVTLRKKVEFAETKKTCDSESECM